MTEAKDTNGVSEEPSIPPGDNNINNHNGYDVLTACYVLSALDLI